MVHFGFLFWGLDQGAAALRHARDVIASLPPDVNVVVGGLNAPPAPFVPEQHRLQPGYAMVDRRLRLTRGARRGARPGPVRLPPLVDFVSPMPYVELQKMLDEANAWGFFCYDKGCYVDELSDGLIDALVERFPDKVSPLSIVLFYRLDGAYSAPAEDATAFSGGRSPRYGVVHHRRCPAPEMLPGERAWVRSDRRRAAPVRRQRRVVRQRLVRVRRARPGGGGVRRSQVRPSRRAQVEVRPCRPAPRQRAGRAYRLRRPAREDVAQPYAVWHPYCVRSLPRELPS